MKKDNQERDGMPARRKVTSDASDSGANGAVPKKDREALMTAGSLSSRINDLFQQHRWEQARNILARERTLDPTSHWVVTQLGVTYYEESKYEQALSLFLDSQKLVDDCPLTLWNLAGTLDALGKHDEALAIYFRLLQSKQTAAEDSCWESQEWTVALKTDCAYRIGICYRRLGEKQVAAYWFKNYQNLLMNGIQASYSLGDVADQMSKLCPPATKAPNRRKLQRIFRDLLDQSGVDRFQKAQ